MTGGGDFALCKLIACMQVMNYCVVAKGISAGHMQN